MNFILLILLLSVASGCSHKGVQKNCDRTESGKYSVCDSLWFWE